MKIALAILLALGFVFAIGGQIGVIIGAYRKTTGTAWQRFLSAFNASETILVARIMSFLSALFAVGIDVLPLLDPASDTGAMFVRILNPDYVPYYTLAAGILVELARRRPGSLNPLPVSNDK